MKDKINSFIHLNENDILSKFNSKDLRHLFFLLEDYLISYKKKLNINDDNISFGLEIETEHTNIETNYNVSIENWNIFEIYMK